MAIMVSNDSVEFSIKASLEKCISFFETLADKSTNKLYNIVIDAIGKESVVYNLGTNLEYTEGPLILIYYLNENDIRLRIFITWKEDHWDVYHEPRDNFPTLLDTRIGRTADGLPTHDA